MENIMLESQVKNQKKDGEIMELDIKDNHFTTPY
jgi:hypothetical protein